MEFAKHIEVTPAANSLNDELGSPYFLEKRLIASIVDLTDKALYKTIIEYAERNNITDVYLLDEEFVKTVLINEAERRRSER